MTSNKIPEWEKIYCTNLDEEVMNVPQQSTTRYFNRKVKSITVCKKDETEVIVEYCSGGKIEWKTKFISLVNCMMWGIPLALDCDYIYVPLENGGLQCLTVNDGNIVWKSKKREHFKNILVNLNGTLCCACGKNRIVVINCIDGSEKISRTVNNSSNNQFEVLNSNVILVELSKNWEIWDSTTLETVESVEKTASGICEKQVWINLYDKWHNK